MPLSWGGGGWGTGRGFPYSFVLAKAVFKQLQEEAGLPERAPGKNIKVAKKFDFFPLLLQFMVKRLIRHWTLFSMSNSTELDEELEASLADEDEWKDFLANNSDFIRLVGN